MTRVRFVFATIIVLLLASACAGSSDQATNANYVSIPSAADSVTTEFVSEGTVRVTSAQSTGLNAGTDAVTVADQHPNLGDWTEAEILSAVEDFVYYRDQVVVGAEHPAVLEGLASPAVVAGVAEQRAVNLDGLETSAAHARSEFKTFPFLIEVSSDGERIAAVVCSERWSLTTNNAWRTVFVDEAYVLNIVGDELVVAEHQVAHDGERTTTGLTCLSGIFGERAVDGARRGIELMDALEADPALATTTDFALAFDGLAYESIKTVGDTIDLTQRRVSPVETRYTPVGLDPSKGWDFIAVVSVCRHYPEGVVNEDIATGQLYPVDENAGPGYSAETLVAVYIEKQSRADGGSEFLWDFETNVNEGCW